MINQCLGRQWMELVDRTTSRKERFHQTKNMMISHRRNADKAPNGEDEFLGIFHLCFC